MGIRSIGERLFRREFLKFLTLAATASVAGETLSKHSAPSGDSRFLLGDGHFPPESFVQTARCEFPPSMSFEEFTELSRKWTKPYEIPKLDEEYFRKGLLLSVHRKYDKGFVQWVYAFKSKADFKNWSHETWARKLFDVALISPRVSYTFSYSEFDPSLGKAVQYMADQPLDESRLQRHVTARVNPLLNRLPGLRGWAARLGLG